MVKNSEKQVFQEEPSVLDYLKAVFSFGRVPIPVIPPLPDESIKPVVKQKARSSADSQALAQLPPDQAAPDAVIVRGGLPILALCTLLFPIIGQNLLKPPLRTPGLAILWFVVAIILAYWAVLRGDLALARGFEPNPVADDLRIKLQPFLIGVIGSFVTYLAFSGLKFNVINLVIWMTTLGFTLYALWQRSGPPAWWINLLEWVKQSEFKITISPWQIVFVLVLGIGIFFRIYRLGNVSTEMFSDQAEKLLDVYDILQGDTKVYFERNTGREGLQMYLTALISQVFNTGISFMSLKIGTVLLGLFTLPYIYLIGQEVGNRWVGLIAMFLAGVAFWPNALARVGLRFILYPAFAAPIIYYMLRGLRRLYRNDFILAGIFLGIGLHGYTPFRIVPVLLVVMVVVYLAHKQTADARNRAVIGLGIAAFISLIIFIPLLRYWVENPVTFNYRTMTRLSSVERALSGPPLEILWNNIWIGLLMFNWADGNIWVISIPGHPLLDVVTGAMLVLGTALVIFRYLRQRDWRLLFFLIAMPVMMLPSTLSLAFPDENPAPNRASGVMVIVFVIAALAIEAILRAFRQKVGGRLGAVTAAILTVFLGVWAAAQNYNTTFNDYHQQYVGGAWNTSELGGVIRDFAEIQDGDSNAWVIAYPHWVDTRLVGMSAGFPTRDFAIWPADLPTTQIVPGPKLFLVKPEDTEGLRALQDLYPKGTYSVYESNQSLHKNFYVYRVPAGE